MVGMIPARQRFESMTQPVPPPGPASMASPPVTPGGGGGRGGCFIASAAYGSSLEPEVNVLRAFRDRYLLSHRPGQALVTLYEQCSPAVAEFIAKHESLPVVGVCYLTLSIGMMTTIGILAALSVGIIAVARIRRSDAPTKAA
jgi:hypothetical protein